jgi:hypothetical protein
MRKSYENKRKKLLALEQLSQQDFMLSFGIHLKMSKLKYLLTEYLNLRFLMIKELRSYKDGRQQFKEVLDSGKLEII